MMHSIVATSVLVLPLVTAAVIPKGTQIGLSYKWDRMSNGELIQAFTSDGSLVASACADGLERDGFALEPVSFLVDPEHPWDGTISVGGVQHDFAYYEHNTTEHPRCALAYNEDFFEVSCQLHYGPGLDMPAIEPPSISECFLPELVPGLGYQNFHLTDTSRARPVAAWNESSDLVPRQSTSRRGTVRVGDGNPHQDPWHNQVTEEIICGGASCTAEISQGETRKFGFMASAGINMWISGGFNVGQSYSSSRSYSCTAQPNQSVCLWHNEIYTAYTVRNDVTVCSRAGCSSRYGSNTVLNSPNTNQQGRNGYYCVVNSCRSEGDGYFDNGPAGPAPQ